MPLPVFSAWNPTLRGVFKSPLNIDTFLYWGWVALLCWIPIPFGSVDRWAWVIIEIGTYTLLTVWCVAYARGAVSLPEPFRRAKWFIWLLVAWLGFVSIYLIPLPLEVIALISPQTAALHRETLLFDSGWRTLALGPDRAVEIWLRTLALIAAFVLTVLLVNTRERARQLLFVMVVLAMVISVYAILMHLTASTISWFGTSKSHAGVAIGTYYHRNHFAGYLEMMLAMGIGLLIADLRDRKATTWKQFLRDFLEWIFSPKMRLRLMLCVLVIALVSTRSRMGNAAFFAALFATGIIGIVFSRYATRSTVALLVSLIVIDVVIVGSWFGVDRLAERIESTSLTKSEEAFKAINAEESVERRLNPTADTLPMILDFPAVGVGPGSWSLLFPSYRGPDYDMFFFSDYAHNDYVQMAAEFGLVGFCILGAMVLWNFAVALMAHAKRRDPLMRGVSFASMMGIISIMIHSSVDFNLQIGANAVYFMVLLALGWIALYLDRRGNAAPSSQMDSTAENDSEDEHRTVDHTRGE